MADDRRLDFMKKWFERGLHATDDPFDRFFSLWICLVVAAQRARTGRPASGATDRAKVRDYFRDNAREIVDALGQHAEECQWLAGREGTDWGTPILDVDPAPVSHPEYYEKLRRELSALSDHLGGRQSLKKNEVASHTAEFLNKVRNNVFHGEKIYDDREDLALLQRVNPILAGILRQIEPTLAAVP